MERAKAKAAKGKSSSQERWHDAKGKGRDFFVPADVPAKGKGKGKIHFSKDGKDHAFVPDDYYRGKGKPDFRNTGPLGQPFIPVLPPSGSKRGRSSDESIQQTLARGYDPNPSVGIGPPSKKGRSNSVMTDGRMSSGKGPANPTGPFECGFIYARERDVDRWLWIPLNPWHDMNIGRPWPDQNNFYIWRSEYLMYAGDKADPVMAREGVHVPHGKKAQYGSYTPKDRYRWYNEHHVRYVGPGRQELCRQFHDEHGTKP